MLDNIPDWILWILLIFAAGVVGQFGKSLTVKFLDQFSKDEENPTESQSAADSANQEAALDAKQQKKLKKAESKLAKKEAKAQTKLGD